MWKAPEATKRMVGLDRPVLVATVDAFDQRQQIAARPRARRRRRRGRFLAGANLVDLVKEDDAVALDLGQRGLDDCVLIEQLIGLGGDQRLVRSAWS